jgi:2-dehydro-3-deoxyphosphogluconate aldolase/(4S)-4-hydroxy-2-oxoglutarate aldolase
MTTRPSSAAQAIRDARLLAILRGPDVDRLADVAEVLVSEGIRALEFPIARPEVLSVVTKIANRLGDTGYVGAGTVRNVTDAQRAIDAGAGFLVAPSLSMPVLEYARERGIGFVPGVFTPSEIDVATQAGAEVVKLFPASSHSPQFVRQLLPPLPDAGIMPTGTITREDARSWLDAGAVALGVGSDLVGDGMATGDYAAVRASAREWLEKVAPAA